ncbi:hypothetical protein AVEN_180450-1 [Araneus ventricosus]|uniref:RNase H type-1 domain-containing protein n=1 Tax=Araneus ventricosus TaxID=182803 RepID=A0A4Y2GM02_ARAVE|nr:hypothetical protein AVEN_180450-1 [Araneus ventricosus]
MKATGWSIHPSEHLKPNQISLVDGEANIAQNDIINIFADGSKTEHGVGAAFCVLTNDIWANQWSFKLNDNNTVFQAELTAFHEAYASHLLNHNTFKISVDNRASIMSSSNSKSTNQTTRQIFKLEKGATQHGQPYTRTKLPKSHIKGLLLKSMF